MPTPPDPFAPKCAECPALYWLVNTHRSFGGTPPDIVSCAPALSADGTAVDRRPGTSREQRSKLPSARRASEEAALALEPRILRNYVGVEHNAPIECLLAVHGADVEGIVRRVFARRLSRASGTQSLAPGQVALGCQPMPVVQAEADETAVVVAPAEAGILRQPIARL